MVGSGSTWSAMARPQGVVAAPGLLIRLSVSHFVIFFHANELAGDVRFQAGARHL